MKRASVYQHGGAVLGLLVALSAAAASGCAGDPVDTLLEGEETPAAPIDDDPTDDQGSSDGAYSGSEDSTFDHMGDISEGKERDPWDIYAQRQEEGPPEIRTRLHSCQKIQNTALRALLEAFAVNIDANGDPPTAGQLFREGQGALGAANYDGRSGEGLVWSAAGAAKLFDIFVQAAPEIIANISTVPQCQIDGVGPEMFDANNECNEDAITCITGRPATPEHIAICNSIVTSATSVDKGKHIAVATLMSAAHYCE
jgi:hypothetical protein